MEKATITNHISETLFTNISMKARENGQPGGVLKDPFSTELMDKLDYDFSKFEGARLSRVGVVVRAQYFDEETKAFIRDNRDKNLIIVHLGAGLDTRYLRIDGAGLPAVFYELDLPAVMDLREQVLPPSHNERIIKASMFETGWMDELAAQKPDAFFLFVMEGVAFYFPEEKIKKLFCDLADRSFGKIFCDLVNVWMIKNAKKHEVMKKMDAKFVFGMDD